MVALLNPKHEKFAQLLAQGKKAAEAYRLAGFADNRAAASRLRQADDVEQRVAEIVAEQRNIEKAATAKAADKLGITRERIMAELAKVAFGDIRKVITWHGSQVEEEDNPEGGEVLVVKHTYSNAVVLVSSEHVDDETAGSIASVKQNSSGGIEVKQHDKMKALELLGKELGMFVDHGEVDVRTYHITDQPMTEAEWASEHGRLN